ncbi:hypothetical protein GGTG_12536 [Gaeumannomyces tritici R3-111a-1]|uniref:Uncharacterized protein n=1 Tax=Gaeumannomyces tritici (strain R3-111a-1) TaxID=644352 RepID=J3PGB1_GAET3|nr:hypothetical protein GGTG_12536 [Gaeumannomyces tritici R3-111a-1]EJT69652.1 hypothetical protein GGTG_12536 [Gaeumannomyces tritici R3-111a-1]
MRILHRHLIPVAGSKVPPGSQPSEPPPPRGVVFHQSASQQLDSAFSASSDSAPPRKLDFLMDTLTRVPRLIQKPTWCTYVSSPSLSQAPIGQD